METLSPSSAPSSSPVLLSDLSSPFPSNLDSPTPSLPSDPSSRSTSSPDPLSDPQLFQPLYPGAEITVCGALCAIMHFCTTNKLSYTAVGELLKLLVLLCPFPSSLPSSFYKFKKFFQQFNPVHNYQKVCIKCKGSCSCDSRSQSDMAHLVQLDIRKPLEKLISGKL